MGFEVQLFFHPKKEEGVGYDTDKQDTLVKKVGKPFEEVELEKLAAVIMSQLARRDILIFDVKIDEFVRKSVSFKESKDGRGIILKNKKFSVDGAAELIAEEIVEAPSQEVVTVPPQPGQLVNLAPQPTQLVNLAPQAGQQPMLDRLYANPNLNIPVVQQKQAEVPVNTRNVLFPVVFEPYSYAAEAKAKKLAFKEGKTYPVHAVRDNPRGNQLGSLYVLTDEHGRQVTVEEKFFTVAGRGLVGDRELDFSGRRSPQKPKLAFEQELNESMRQVQGKMTLDAALAEAAAGMMEVPDIRNRKQAQQPVAKRPPVDIPVDDGMVPEELMEVPDIRSRGAARPSMARTDIPIDDGTIPDELLEVPDIRASHR